MSGKGPTWLFDLDYLTDSMNYHPIRLENQANQHVGQQETNQNTGIEDIIEAGDSEQEDESTEDCFVLPIWPSYSSTITPDLKTDEKRDGLREEKQVFMDELERLRRQEKEANEEAKALRKKFEHLVIKEGAARHSNTNIFSTVSTPTKASSTNLVNTVSIPVSTASLHEGLSLSDPTNPEEDDSEIPPLKDIYQNLLWKKAIDTKWVYRNKKDERGVVVRNKASHKDLFWPLPLMGFIVYQMDVKSAFLYGKIDEEVYVSQPPELGYVPLSSFLPLLLIEEWIQEEVSIDKNSLHKDGQTWYHYSFKSYVDVIILWVYNRSLGVDEFEQYMKSKFQMSSMGELTFFLGLQVKQKEDGIFISQDKSMIGSLMYLTASRPDIMFAVCACSRFQVTPKSSHLSAVKRIFRYLKGKPKLGLWYPRVSSFDLKSYSDIDYAGANLDRKSITGGCQFLGRRLISWQCKKQTIVATSTTEAEYVAAASCCGQVLWIQNQMLDYGFNFMNTKIYIDNESTICIVKNPVYHSKTKHIAIRHHFIRDAYEKKLIQVLKIHTNDNVADLLTKAFDVSRGLIAFRGSLRRVTDGTEALLILPLFILWLNKVSTDSAKLVPLGKVCTAIETLKKNTARALISLLTTITLSTTMAVLDSCPKHNMVAYLEKTEGNAEFHEIIDFLKRSSIHHALTVSPVVSTTFVEQFWTSAKSNTSTMLGTLLPKDIEAQPTHSHAPTSGCPNEPQTDSSPAQTSEVPIEHQPNLSPRPSPTTTIPDSIPETSGENLGGHSSSDKSLSGNEGDMTLQSVYDLCLSLCAQVSDQAGIYKHLKAQITKLKKQAKPVIKHHRALATSVS
ncbi:hypothetical protein Tco_0830905 [Tanacetum coccineum]